MIDGKPYKNSLVYDISYKTLIDAKPLRLRFDKIDGFIRVYDGTKYLVLFGSERFDCIYRRIRYLLGGKWGITYLVFHYYAKIKIDSSDDFCP